MTEYVERAYVITAAHLLFEILDVCDSFCISLMQMNRTKKCMDHFCRILDEKKTYKIHGVFENHLPISKLKSAPIITS